MEHTISTCQPFSFEQTLTFARRFPAFEAEAIITDDSLTAAITVGDKAQPFTLRSKGSALIADAASREVARRAAELVGAEDDLRPFYAVAEGDAPFQPIVRSLRGLHHLRFLGLEDAAVYSVLMQRSPIKLAVTYKRRFLDRFGHRVRAGERTLRAMPSLDELAELDADEIAEALGHRPKAERIAVVTRGVAKLGEKFLREARYAEAKEALLAIPGVGPFSAGAILLRGLGRMDEVPSVEMFERDGRVLYGRAWNPRAIEKRYGGQIGYWSYYLKAGVARLVEQRARA